MKNKLKIWFQTIYKITEYKDLLIVEVPLSTIINYRDLEIGHEFHYSFYNLMIKNCCMWIIYKKDAE